MTSDQPAPIGQAGQRAAWSSRINRLSDRDAHYFDFLIDVPALAGNEHANYLLGVLAYEQAEVRIYPARYELVIGGTPLGTHNVASTAGRHNLGICAKGALSGEVSGVWLDGAQIFNGVGLWTQSPPRALFTTQNADPAGLTQINGVVLLEFFAYVKSFLRTVDDSDLTMGSGTFGGGGSGNGVTPPAMPRATLCVPDGPAACSVYELALDGSGNTTGAPAMDEQGDSTRQTTWRPFLTEPATLLHVVNGSRDAAATLAPGYGAEGGSVGPLAINAPDAVDEAHWYVKPVASLPGHTPATSGGAGLPHAPLYVCSGFNRKHGTGDDRTTAPPDAYPLPVASAPGGGDPGSSDGESKASTGPCACSLGNPSVANAASTTDPGLGVMLPGYVDPIMASVLPVGPGGVQPTAIIEVGWDPDDTWKALGKRNPASQAKLKALLDAGWRIATDSDGGGSISALGGNNSNVRVDVRSDGGGGDWAKWLANGGKGQWRDGKWGISSDSKLIYIDSEDDDEAAEILDDLMKKITGKPKDAARHVDSTDFHDLVGSNFWQACGKLKGALQDAIQSATLTHEEVRYISQLGAMEWYGALGAILDAFDSA